MYTAKLRKFTGSISRRAKLCAIAFLLAAVVWLAYRPVLANDFTGYDDPEYVTQNPHVNSGLSAANIAWAFRAAHSNNWHPLTWLSHALDCALFGLRPSGHHAISLALHIANTVLLFLWLAALTGSMWRGAAVAAIFGVHPLHVESVAWVAERKDVLSTFFFLLALLAYSAQVKRGGAARYSMVAILFACGLMAKPMLVTFPLILLLLDCWPYARKDRRRMWLEKLPLLALSAASCALTLWAQRQGGAVAALDRLPLGLRLENAVVSYLRYLAQMAYPVRLAAIYPFPLHGLAAWTVIASVLAIAAITAASVALRRRRPWLLTGWGWYLITLLPVIGIVQVGMQAMADRYMYIPMIGLLMAVVWEGARLPRPAAAAATIAVLAVSGVLTWRQAHVWHDGATLFAHAVAVTEDNFIAHDNLGVELDRQGRSEEALAHYREAVRIRPGDRNSEKNYALATFAKAQRLFQAGQLQQALPLFREGLRHQSGNSLAHTYTGLILAQDTARLPEAAAEFEEAIRDDPANVDAHYYLGVIHAAQGDLAGAARLWDAALRINPGFAPARAARAQLTGSEPRPSGSGR
jgi:tetratricopeptide (TPR) repeat protein